MTFCFEITIGRGLPFLIVGIFAGAISRLARLSWICFPIQIISGCALLFVALYIYQCLCELTLVCENTIQLGEDDGIGKT